MSKNRDFDFKQEEKSRVIAVYRYENEAAEVVFEKERHEPKSFRFRRQVNGRYVYNLKGVKPVPYRLPKWKDASTVIVCEGEKDADNLAKFRFATTSSPFGADNWPPEITSCFAFKMVYILYDIDIENKRHPETVAATLHGTAREIRICRLPLTEHEADVTDYINQVPPSDHQRVQQIKLVQDLLRNTELYQPPEIVTDNPTVLSEAEKEAIEERAAIMEDD